MSKLSFKKDIYREALNLLCVKMPTTEVFIPVDYRLDFSDNAASR